MEGNSVFKCTVLLFYCSLALLVVTGSSFRDHEEYPIGLTYRSLPGVQTHAVNVSVVEEPVHSKGLWDFLVDGPNGDHSKVVVFSTNIWGGFGNSFRGLRGLCIYALLKGAKIRGPARNGV